MASEFARMPAVPPSHEIVTDLLMYTNPKLPPVRQLISPKASVAESAWSKVAHGWARVQGLESLPSLPPETQVRDAAAAGTVIETIRTRAAATRVLAAVRFFIAASS